MKWAATFGVVLAAASPTAWAQEETDPPPGLDGAYLTLGGSLGAVNDPQTTDDFEVDLGIEFGLFVGVGYELGPFRVEGQFLSEAFQVNNLNRGPTTSLPAGDYSGSLSSIGLMANAIVEIERWPSIRPYLGIGGGFAYMSPDYRDNSCVFFFCTTGESAVDGYDFVNAWQGMAGIAVPSQRSNGVWDFAFRYYGTSSADFRVAGGNVFTQEGIRSQSFQIGYRLYFGGSGD